MNQPNKPNQNDDAAGGDHMLNEADIGSGERTPAQKETDEEIKSIPKLPEDGQQSKPGQAPGAK